MRSSVIAFTKRSIGAFDNKKAGYSIYSRRYYVISNENIENGVQRRFFQVICNVLRSRRMTDDRRLPIWLHLAVIRSHLRYNYAYHTRQPSTLSSSTGTDRVLTAESILQRFRSRRHSSISYDDTTALNFTNSQQLNPGVERQSAILNEIYIIYLTRRHIN